MSIGEGWTIPTIYGEMIAQDLVKREGVIDNDNERTTWVEYWRGDELVHRSAHVTIKQWPDGLGAIAADFGS